MSRHAQIRLGTSGWDYAHWRGRFYPEGLPAPQWFGYYRGVFDTVEINHTFYRLPAPGVFDGWRQQAPRGFLYAVKASRFITHITVGWLDPPGRRTGALRLCLFQ